MKPGEVWKFKSVWYPEAKTFTIRLLHYEGGDNWMAIVVPASVENKPYKTNISGKWIYENCRRIV